MIMCRRALGRVKAEQSMVCMYPITSVVQDLAIITMVKRRLSRSEESGI